MNHLIAVVVSLLVTWLVIAPPRPLEVRLQRMFRALSRVLCLSNLRNDMDDFELNVFESEIELECKKCGEVVDSYFTYTIAELIKKAEEHECHR